MARGGCLHRGVEANQFLDRIVDQVRAVAQQRPLFGMLREGDQAVADQGCRRLAAGEQQESEHGEQLVVVQLLTVIGRSDEDRDQIVARLDASLLYHLGEVDVQFGDASIDDLGVEAVEWIDKPSDVVGHRLEPRPSLGRQTEELADRIDREW